VITAPAAAANHSGLKNSGVTAVETSTQATAAVIVIL
jgi:hypothetical protein